MILIKDESYTQPEVVEGEPVDVHAGWVEGEPVDGQEYRKVSADGKSYYQTTYYSEE